MATIPYNVSVPYAGHEKAAHGHVINSFKEKPTYTYYCNGGIYLMKRSVLKYNTERTVIFNATDLMEKLIQENKKVVSLSFRWLLVRCW